MPRKVEISGTSKGDSFVRRPERDPDRNRMLLTEVFSSQRFIPSIGLDLVAIHDKSGIPITLDSLRVFIKDWEIQKPITFTDQTGIKWVVVTHRVSGRDLLCRQPVVSLDQSIKIKEERSVITTPLIDLKGEKSESFLSQVMSTSTPWNFHSVLSQLEALVPPNITDKWAYIRKLFASSISESKVDSLEDEAQPIDYLRLAVLSSIFSIYSILNHHDVLDAVENPLDRTARLHLDPRWIPLIPSIIDITTKYKATGYELDAAALLPIYSKLLTQQTVSVDQKGLLVQSVAKNTETDI